MTDDATAALAAALYHPLDHNDHEHCLPWAACPDDEQGDVIEDAQSIIAALAAAGWRIVDTQAICIHDRRADEMCSNCGPDRRIWRDWRITSAQSSFYAPDGPEPDDNPVGLPRCHKCGDVTYQPESFTARRAARRCAGCHRVTGNCNCAADDPASAALDAALARERRLRRWIVDDAWQYRAVDAAEAEAEIDAALAETPEAGT